ncbi:hypothetical protein K443DRAFT_378817 [Laccaria amethystina LaAM-08-1]|uniref:Unplaced genomic scaffold K443scaffold_29, whole genome shotgun sequence n=1 Tax=Laccaria amethystina LaAM-08-1 TaxID=1095629 RepID=A0A0C9XJ14_9AGAR|nr:hypothetical protein K443DRAFT_378817 [Laccaria amethystina LaAM-08-1]
MNERPLLNQKRRHSLIQWIRMRMRLPSQFSSISTGIRLFFPTSESLKADVCQYGVPGMYSSQIQIICRLALAQQLQYNQCSRTTYLARF